MKRAILCVVKDPRDVQPLAALQHVWDIASTGEAGHALDMLAQRQFEVVVADSRVPGRDGMSFLTLVMNRYPAVLRILMFDPADTAGQPQALQGDPASQHWMAKPCTAEALKGVLEKARTLERWLDEPAIRPLLARLTKLPSVPAIYVQVLKALRSPDTGLDEVGRLLSQDLALTAKVLQLVNSAAFGLQRDISSLAEAIGHLGIEQTKALVLMAHAFSSFEGNANLPFSIEALWRHSMGTGRLAQWMVRDVTGDLKLAEEAFTAGVLHDVGKLMLGANLPQEYGGIFARARERKIPFATAEREVLGTSHAEVGACLLGTWGLPFGVVEAIAFHHTPSRHPSKAVGPVTAIHVANVLDHELQPSSEEMLLTNLDHEYLAQMNLENFPDRWREVYRGGV
jgi:HD-like signal output (HDOD) protein/CheY-like chemotaxis protein